MNQLITACLKKGDILPLVETPRELMNKFEAEMIDWISEYVRKFGESPSAGRLEKEFPYFIPITYSADEPPLGDIAEQTIERKLREFWEANLQDALVSLREGEELPFDRIASVQRVSAATSGVSKYSTFDRTAYFREKAVNIGIRLIDRATGGIGKGEVMVIVGRLGTGKTMMSLFFAFNWWKNGKKILFVSNEMLPGDVFARLDAISGKFSPLIFRTSEREDVMPLASSAADYARKVNAETGGEIIIPKRRLSTPNQVFALASDLMVDAVVIDGLYLMRTEDRYAAKWERVAAVSNETKQLALTTQVPVLALAQLKRTGGRPEKYDPEDIAYSDAIGQDADFVLALSPSVAVKERIEMQLIKNRFGPEMATVCSIDYDTMTMIEDSVEPVTDDDWLIPPETMKKIEGVKEEVRAEAGTFVEAPKATKPKKRRKAEVAEDEEDDGGLVW